MNDDDDNNNKKGERGFKINYNYVPELLVERI